MAAHLSNAVNQRRRYFEVKVAGENDVVWVLTKKIRNLSGFKVANHMENTFFRTFVLSRCYGES